MINYTKANINVITFFVTIIIYFIINLFSQTINLDSNSKNSIQENSIQENSQSTEEDIKVQEKNNVQKKWIIEIPKIQLKAEIAEGTQKEVMDKYVGHFEETNYLNGNVGLAAHNRGYSVNYFADIKNLEKGDEIQYTYNNNKKIYIVDKIEIIKDTDWSNLEQTVENKITLITCVEDAPTYRRCIQGTEKGGS